MRRTESIKKFLMNNNFGMKKLTHSITVQTNYRAKKRERTAEQGDLGGGGKGRENVWRRN